MPDDLLSVRHRTGKSADKFLFHCSCHTFASDSEPRYHAFVSKLIASDEGRGGIGTKNVAIDMSAFNAMPADTGSKDNAPTGDASDPTIVKLKVAWTKDQLKEAPDFQYYKPPARTGSAQSPSTTGQAPRPVAPAKTQ